MDDGKENQEPVAPGGAPPLTETFGAEAPRANADVGQIIERAQETAEPTGDPHKGHFPPNLAGKVAHETLAEQAPERVGTGYAGSAQPPARTEEFPTPAGSIPQAEAPAAGSTETKKTGFFARLFGKK